MEHFTREVIFIIAVVFVYTWWFLSVKNKTLKKYILLQSISLIVGVGVYIAMKSFDLPLLSFLGIITLIGAIVFFVKAILLKRRLDKNSE